MTAARALARLVTFSDICMMSSVNLYQIVAISLSNVPNDGVSRLNPAVTIHCKQNGQELSVDARIMRYNNCEK